jgi:hypothetical protein
VRVTAAPFVSNCTRISVEVRVVDPTFTYLMYAQIAADLAADEHDPIRRASLLEMAQAWQDLASGAPPTPPGGQRHPRSNDNAQR